MIKPHGKLDSSSLVLGEEAGSYGRVKMAGGSFSAEQVTIGGRGEGKFGVVGSLLPVTISASVDGGVIIGDEAGAKGVLNVGYGFQFEANDMVVGNQGAGKLNVYANSQVLLAGSLQVGSEGDVFLRESTLKAGRISVDVGGSINGTGRLIASQGIQNSGWISPGLSPGTLTIEGDYTQTDNGHLRIQIGGTDPTLCDRLEVTGEMALGGTLELSFINGFYPQQGDELGGLLGFGNSTGSFQDLTISGILPGWQYESVFDGSSFAIRSLSDAEPAPDLITLRTVASGGWSIAATWDDGTQAPTHEFNVVIGNHTVVVEANGTVKSLEIAGADGRVVVDAGVAVDVVEGMVVAPDSCLEIGVGGTQPGRINVGDNVLPYAGASLELKVNGANPFVPGTYTLISSAGSAGITGRFDAVADLGAYATTGPGGNGLEYVDTPDGQVELQLTIDKDLNPGDANLDAVTDVRDFNQWNANKFSSLTDWAQGDFNGDGVTDVRDFNQWNAHKFTSATVPPPLAEGQVPEPTTLTLLALGALFLAGYGCRHRWRPPYIINSEASPSQNSHTNSGE